MKKVIKYVLPLFAIATLALSFYSCGKKGTTTNPTSETTSVSLSGSKYRADGDSTVTISFLSATEFKMFKNGIEDIKGTYEVAGKTVSLKAKWTAQASSETVSKWTIEENGNKLKDEDGRLYTKI